MEFENIIFIGPFGSGKTTELQKYLDKQEDKDILIYQKYDELKGPYSYLKTPVGFFMTSDNLASVIGELTTPEDFRNALKVMCTGSKLATTMFARTYNEAIERLIENGLTIELARSLNIKLVFVKNFFINGAKYLSDSDYLYVAQYLIQET